MCVCDTDTRKGVFPQSPLPSGRPAGRAAPELQAHHRQLEPLAALRPSAALAEHLALVRQELEERGASERILYALVEPPAPAPAPPPAAAPGRGAGDPGGRSFGSAAS